MSLSLNGTEMKTTLPANFNPLNTYTLRYTSTQDVYLKPKRINLINYNHVLLDLKMLQLGKEELTTSLAAAAQAVT